MFNLKKGGEIMKKKYFGILIVLIALTFIFSGCLQQIPPADNGNNGEGVQTIDLYQAKLDYLVNDTANATITGVAIYHFNYTILFDGTTGIYLKEVVLNDGEMATVSGEFYKDTYNGQVRMRNITILSTETSVEPEPVVLDKVLDNSWLLDSGGDTTSPEDHALWIYRFVTASGTLTSLDNDGKLFEFEYPIESGTATITVYTYTAVSTCTDTPATVTGYLAGYKHVWQIYPRTPSDIEF